MKIDPQFSSHWRTYALQSVYASIAVFFITLVLGMEHAVVITSIGATSFIVFAMPTAKACQSAPNKRKSINGKIAKQEPTKNPCKCPPIIRFGCPDTLFGITLFAMVVLDFEHPPAAGTALGMTVTGYSQDAAIAIITSVILLALISHYAKPFIRDLV